MESKQFALPVVEPVLYPRQVQQYDGVWLTAHIRVNLACVTPEF